MHTLLVDYNRLDGLLNTLSRLSFKLDDGCIDTWEVKSKDCTSCINVIKHEQFNQGAKEVITDGCKVPDQFITNPDNPMRCEHYKGRSNKTCL